MTVSALRSQLRAHGKDSLAVVKNADLPIGTPPSGAEKTEATKRLLRRRLAQVIIQQRA